MDAKALSLIELNSLVRRSLEVCLPDSYWLQAETSDVHTNYSGHCYLEFVQKDERSNALVAKARGMIWNNVFASLQARFERETGQAFVSGIKILVQVKVTFHELYGYSLTVTDIDPTYTLGDMARRRKEILNRLEEEGVLTLNKELEWPVPAQRIAVISSATAAGYGDFCNQLGHNPFGFVFYTRLFPAVMQGEHVEESVIAALDRIYEEAAHWDVVVIIRGGGAASDLSGFDTYRLAAHCAQFPLPILTGIGHERDDTVIDLVAHTRVKTPTAAAGYLIDRMREAAETLEACTFRIHEGMKSRITSEQERLEGWVARIPARVQMRLQTEHFRQERLTHRIQAAWQNRLLHEQYRLRLWPRLAMAVETNLQREKHRLQLLTQQAEAASPQRLLARGYSITLKEGMPVTDVTQVNKGDRIETRVAKGRFESIVN